MDEIDSRIPTASTLWQLWHHDVFDRDAPPYLQASGAEILHGLYELWLYTLQEGIQDNGSASFSRFHLSWGITPATRVEVVVHPLDNPALLKLRLWADLMSHQQEGEGIQIARQHIEQSSPVLMKLARLHYELLRESDRWTAEAIDWGAESRDLLARVELMKEPGKL